MRPVDGKQASCSASFSHWFKTQILDMLFNRDDEGSVTSVVPLHKTEVPLGVVNKAEGSDCQTNKLTALTQCTCFVTVAETVWVICEVASSTR